MKKRILSNIFSTWANFLIIIIARFLLTPFLIHKLGDEEYGIWVLILSIIGYLELLNLGINTGIIRYSSKYIEIKDYKKVNEVFNTALCIFSSLALFVLILVFILANYLPTFFAFSTNNFYKLIFIFIGINLAFTFISYVFSAILNGQQKIVEINIISTSIFLIRTILVVIFLMAGYKLLALTLIQICTNMVTGILLTIYSLKVTPELKFDFKAINRDSFKTIFNYTFYNLLLKLSAKINLTGGILIIGHFLSAGAITFYSIAINLMNYLYNVIMQMQAVLLPRFSQLESQNKNEQIQEHFLTLNRYTLIIAIPVTFGMIFYGDSFIKLWIGAKYADLTGKILSILAFGQIFQILQLSTETVLKGIGKHKNLSFITIVESISVITLSILLVGKYELIGIAYAYTIPVIFFNLFIIPVFACNLLKISIVSYYLKYVLKNIFVIIPLFLIFRFINYPINSYPALGISVLSIIIVSLIVSFFLILDLKERKLIYSLFRIER